MIYTQTFYSVFAAVRRRGLCVKPRCDGVERVPSRPSAPTHTTKSTTRTMLGVCVCQKVIDPPLSGSAWQRDDRIDADDDAGAAHAFLGKKDFWTGVCRCCCYACTNDVDRDAFMYHSTVGVMATTSALHIFIIYCRKRNTHSTKKNADHTTQPKRFVGRQKSRRLATDSSALWLRASRTASFVSLQQRPLGIFIILFIPHSKRNRVNNTHCDSSEPMHSFLCVVCVRDRNRVDASELKRTRNIETAGPCASDFGFAPAPNVVVVVVCPLCFVGIFVRSLHHHSTTPHRTKQFLRDSGKSIWQRDAR